MRYYRKREKNQHRINQFKSSLLLAIPFSLIIVALITNEATKPNASTGPFPIYLTYEEKANPILFAIKMFPYSYLFSLFVIVLYKFIFSNSNVEKGIDDNNLSDSIGSIDGDEATKRLEFEMKYNIIQVPENSNQSDSIESASINSNLFFGKLIMALIVVFLILLLYFKK